MQNKKYIFHVDGMHCKSCGLVIEQELGDLSYVQEVKADLKTQTLEVVGDFEGIPQEALAKDFSAILAQHKYIVSVEKNQKIKNLSDFKIAIPVALVFIIGFVLLQKAGLANFIKAEKMSLGVVFSIGFIASLSSCMAVVGGLLLSMSATFAKEGDKFKPQFLFHIGRLLSFFILGGFIGFLGSAFKINPTVYSILGFVVAFVMLFMGLNLLDVFHFAKRFSPSMPKFLSKKAIKVSQLNHTITPFLVGIITFFLPCGFTQSMQIYSLSLGNFWQAGITMFVFALGTLPLLSLVSFGSLGFKNKKNLGIFFKTAGIIVIAFSVFGIINSMVVLGWIRPIFNF